MTDLRASLFRLKMSETNIDINQSNSYNQDNEKPEYFYKFRSLSNLRYFLDIILNNRLFASTFQNLDDPMEGIYKSDKSLRGVVTAHPTNPVECCADANPKTMLPNDT